MEEEAAGKGVDWRKHPGLLGLIMVVWVSMTGMYGESGNEGKRWSTYIPFWKSRRRASIPNRNKRLTHAIILDSEH